MMNSKAQNVNDEIKKLAKSTSSSTCAKVVREAVQRALGIPVGSTGIISAKDYGSWLEELGFVNQGQLTSSSWRAGDVAVLEGSEEHKHGHIQVYCDDGKWRSDFVQTKFSPYKDKSEPGYNVYRYP